MHCTSASILRSALLPATSRASAAPLAFLLPAFTASTSTTPTAPFSTSRPCNARKDGNRSRGVSALRHTGLGKSQRLSVSQPPQPVLDPARRSAIQVVDDHPLFAFFPSPTTRIATPEELNSHGRAWTPQELRQKDWDDLHRLWWTCCIERNRLMTGDVERKRLGGRRGMYGDYESGERMKEVKGTMKAVKFVLTERWYTWENARVEGMKDEEVDLYADVGQGERAYLPREEGEDEMTASLGTEDDARTDPLKTLPPPDGSKGSGEARV
ncbi:54S ribosomal protein L4 mitochondrial [Teratosphaeriaceae sp. CCFEE 6253]|nr:54S ribosomal protein L4 mitochondrial [Teratosphaeriaceae sp. CCFEE 6253]